MVTRQPGDRAPAPDPARFVQSFVNSVNVEFGPDRFGDPAQVSGWVREYCPQAGGQEFSEEDRVLLVAAREQIRALLRANAGHGSPDWSRTAALAEAAGVAITPGTDSLLLVPSGTGVQAVLGKLLASVLEAQLLGLWPRLKACEEDRCLWAFYDRSRNGAGRWCSMAVCGSRAKMSTYRGRRRDPAPGA